MTVQKPTENDQSSISNHNKNRIKSLLLYCASFITLTVIYYYFSTFFGLNSDRASILLEAKDILNGNIFLHGWYLSTVPFYFTETLPLAFLSLLFGPKSFLLHLMPALYYSLVVLLSFNLMRKKNKSCIPFIGLLLIPSPFFASISLTAPIHVGAIIISLVIIRLCVSEISKTKKIVIAIIGGVALYSDNILLYFLVIPLFISILILVIKKKTTLSYFVLPIGIIIFSKLTSFLLDKINAFITPGIMPPKFATPDQIFFNLKIMIEGLLKLFGANFLGGAVDDATTLMALTNLIIISCFFIMAIKTIKENSTFDFVDYILLSSSVMMPIAFLTSNIPSDIWSSRYLSPSIISLIIFIGRNATIKKYKFIILSIGAILFCFINYLNLRELKKNKTNYLVSEYIKEKKLGDGFANYWRSLSVSVIMDDGNTVIVPVNVSTDDNNIYAYKWLSNSQWFTLQSRYIILNSDEQLHALIKKFGNDAHIKKIDDTYIVIYKEKRLSITG